MQELLAFLVRYSHFMLFCILQFFSFYLIINYNQAQKEIFFNTTNTFTGQFQKKYDEVKSSFISREILDSLSDRIKDLEEEKEIYRMYLQTHVEPVKDSLYTQKYELISAKIIYNSVNTWDNFILIDKGSKDGVQKGMGVITSKGVIGIVRNVSEHYAKIMSLLNSQTRISACLSKSNHFGTITWRGIDPTVTTLIDLPSHAKLAVNDTVVTTQYSQIFPQGINIGRIEKFYFEGGSNFYTVDVKLFEDLSNVQFVMVVKNLYKSEADSLLNQSSL